MSAEQSQAVKDLMALAYKHSQLYYDWHNDAVRYKTFEAARDELRAATASALREQYCAGMERGAQECDHWQRLGNTKHQCGAYIAGAIRGIASKLAVAAEVGK